jgi:alpha-glucosidase
MFAPSAPKFEPVDTEFLLGPDLLVAPQPFGEMVEDYPVLYPPGEWYDFWTGRKMPLQPFTPTITEAAANPDKHFPEQAETHPVLDTLPVYVRAGSILTMQPLVQSTDETPRGPLELRVYPGPHCYGSIYLDDGHTFRYQHGEFLRQTFTCQSENDSVTLKFLGRQGTYSPWWKNIEVVVYNWQSATAEAKVSTQPAPLKTTYDAAAHALHILVPDMPTTAQLQVRQTHPNQ